ncbi:LppU/SCO3897 family protein [Jongsikchunia kroppenstedtii]|uniref:LppU/SCO3897 family protein n=1 Tax=Jongsikchunia kroppenstedtii TaxID=1121721 RepID=UPI0003630B52|nr:hypothetical protein [Jongsikchunia kroppenstedtii]
MSNRMFTLLVVGAVLAMIGIAVGVVFAVSKAGNDRRAEVGNCLQVVQTSPAKLRNVSCDDQSFNYIVAAKVDKGQSCPTKAYGYVAAEDGSRLCLTPSYREGKCYLLDQRGKYTKITDSDCDATTSDGQHVIKVVARVESTDVPNCQDSRLEIKVSYPQPSPIGYCLLVRDDEPQLTDPYGQGSPSGPDSPYGSDPDSPDPGQSDSPTTPGTGSLPTI